MVNIFGWFRKLFQGNKDKFGFFYKHFIHKNFIMNFKISGFVGFTGSVCNLHFVKVTATYVDKSRNFRCFMKTFFIRTNK